MTAIHERLRETETADVPSVLQRAGVSGAGGGGFPTYVKWQSLDAADHLLVNHQESEPNCYVDKWIAREHATDLAALFDALLETHLDAVVVGAKKSDRDPWHRPLERATDAVVYDPDDLPVDVDGESGVVMAYTDDTYEYGMENVLLRVAADTVIGKDLPVDYGWIVQNTETVYNIHRALAGDHPVTRKCVHVDGVLDGDRLSHRMLDVPVGTAAARLLEAAGVDPATVPEDATLVHGGPGWCFEVHRPPARFGVRKHTNCLLLLDEEAVAANTYGNGRINVLDTHDWDLRDPETEPTRLSTDRVHVPIVTNDDYGDLVAPSTPAVDLGESVESGQVIADPLPQGDGFCLAHHAPIDGEVVDVTTHEVEILAGAGD